MLQPTKNSQVSGRKYWPFLDVFVPKSACKVTFTAGASEAHRDGRHTAPAAYNYKEVISAGAKCQSGEVIRGCGPCHCSRKLCHSYRLNDLEHSWSTNHKDEQSQQPGSHRILVLRLSRALWDISSVDNIFGRLFIGNFHSLCRSHGWMGNEWK